MQHAAARAAIAEIIGGGGFGDRAFALASSALLADLGLFTPGLCQRAIERSAAMGADPVPGGAHAVDLEPVPNDQQTLCAQLAPVIVQSPRQVGAQLASLAALAALWPHAASEERATLRHRFALSAQVRSAPEGSWVDERQLCAWQRDLPTSHGGDGGLAGLRALLDAGGPFEAYAVIAEHLGTAPALGPLSAALGTLAAHVLVRHRDPEGRVTLVLAGAAAAPELWLWTAPEHATTLIAQLAHELWWCRRRAGLPAVRACLDAQVQAVRTAVRSGDITAAQRAARASAADPQGFYQQVEGLLDEAAGGGDATWLQALGAAAAVTARARGGAPAPDDAAALGALLADLAYRGALPGSPQPVER